MNHQLLLPLKQCLWLVAALALGFFSSALWASALRWPRAWFVLPFAAATLALFAGYLRWSAVDVKGMLFSRWRGAAVVGAIVGALMVSNVVSQPAAPRPQGGQLLFALVWLGGVYGTVDALLLSVLPVIIVHRAFFQPEQRLACAARLAVSGVALAASLLVTAAYHLGYPEFRGATLLAPLIGNGVMTLAFLLTMNPSTAVISHVAMHVAAVWHGMETALQLPPHY